MSEANSCRSRRRHSDEFKREVVEACCRPGVSIAGVALAHGLNANLVRRWLVDRGVTPASRRAAQSGVVATAKAAPEFIPLTVAPATPTASEIRIEVRRGAATVVIRWPADAARECSQWLREWLG